MIRLSCGPTMSRTQRFAWRFARLGMKWLNVSAYCVSARPGVILMIWAHYSDKHKGLCLGFEIPSEVERAQTRKVDYISTPLSFPTDFLLLDTQQQLPMAEKMIFTKYRNWEYEHEIRTW